LRSREKLRAVAAQYGANLRIEALQFSVAPDVAAALIVGARSEEQILANVTSMQARIPPEFWAELKRHSSSRTRRRRAEFPEGQISTMIEARHT
jgi:aryl-alcohol dehydrogenase-like predicted oxidoreductase